MFYCLQSAHFDTGLKKEGLIELDRVWMQLKKAKEAGSQRFGMGAAWRDPRDQDLEKVCEMVKEVKKLGLETCVTLGLLKGHQAQMLKDAGLDFIITILICFLIITKRLSLPDALRG